MDSRKVNQAATDITSHDDSSSVQVIAAGLKIQDKRMFNILHLILTNRLKVESVNKKRFNVDPKDIKLHLTALGWPCDGGQVAFNIVDTVESLELSRHIWKLLRPFDPPIHIPFELHDAIESWIQGWVNFNECDE